jgi:hypothetical protein
VETTKKSNILIIIFGIFLFLLLASNIFTIYLLMDTKDSLNNKNQTLAVNKGKIEIQQKENADLKGIKEKYTEALKDNEILDGRVADLTAEITKLNGEIEQRKSTQSQQVQAQSTQPSQQANNPVGAITVGSSKEHVRKIMGNPDSIILTSWWYGKQSWVSFDNNGLVDSWYNGGNNLKTK